MQSLLHIFSAHTNHAPHDFRIQSTPQQVFAELQRSHVLCQSPKGSVLATVASERMLRGQRWSTNRHSSYASTRQLSNPALPSFPGLSLCPGRSSLSGCSPALIFRFGKFNIASMGGELLARSWSHTHRSTSSAVPRAKQVVHSRSADLCLHKAQGQHPDTLPPFEGFVYTSRSSFLMPPNIWRLRAGMRKLLLEV